MSEVLPLSVRSLTVQRGGKPLLNVPDWQLQRGESVALIGPNGAGKSLLLRALTGLLDNGVEQAVSWAGQTPGPAVMSRCGVVMQQPLMLRRSVEANLYFALERALAGDALKAQAAQALHAAELADKAAQSARVLSGGERMRLAVARALALSPDCLLLDEPTASLDHSSARNVEALVSGACASGATLLLITHDLALARRLCSRTVLMHRGEIIADAATDTFFDSPPNSQAEAFVRGEYLE